MSCLQNEMILENLFDEVWEDFRVSNKLTVNQMNELCSYELLEEVLFKSANY